MLASMKKIILLAICLFSFSFTYANEVVRVRKAVGRWEVSDDITPKQAEEKALNEAKTVKGQPCAIVMTTVKGKGVSYMENNAGWHGKAPNDAEFEQAMAELNAAMAELEGK